MMLEADASLLDEIRHGYKSDKYCKKLKSASASFSDLKEINGLWYIGNRLIVPRTGTIRKDLFQLAHDTLGHFGAKKSYVVLHDSYYWPGCAGTWRNLTFWAALIVNTTRAPRASQEVPSTCCLYLTNETNGLPWILLGCFQKTTGITVS
jgi:hypothetical protein